MRRRTSISIVTLPFVAVAFLAFGPNRCLRFGGDPDLGPVAFETFERRSTPNDALACPPALCAARSDLTPTLYGVSARDLCTAFAKVIASELRVSRGASDDPTRPSVMFKEPNGSAFPTRSWFDSSIDQTGDRLWLSIRARNSVRAISASTGPGSPVGSPSSQGSRRSAKLAKMLASLPPSCVAMARHRHHPHYEILTCHAPPSSRLALASCWLRP